MKIWFGPFTNLVVVFLLALTARSAFADCLPSSDVAAIKSELQFNKIAVDDAQFCDSNSQAYKVFQSLIIIKKTHFPALRKLTEVDRNLFGTDFWSYFTARIKTVENSTPDGCDGIMAFVITALQAHTIYICPKFYEEQTSQVERMVVLLHEPRHDEAQGFKHIDCTQPFTRFSGNACDNSVQDQGAWAFTIEAFQLLATYGNLSLVESNIARYKMLEIGSSMFNQPIFSMEKDSAIYLKSQDGKSAYIFSDSKLKGSPLIQEDAISRRFSISVFPKDKSNSFTAGLFTRQLQMLPALGASAASYNQQAKEDRNPIVDILNDDDAMVAVSAHTVDVLGTPKFDVPFEIKSIVSSLEAGYQPSPNFFLVDQQSQFHKVTLGRGGNVTVSAIANPLNDFSRVVIYRGQRLGLRLDGSVMVNQNNEWTEFAPLKNRKFSFMSRPFLWSDFSK